jgi:hypothetical protein
MCCSRAWSVIQARRDHAQVGAAEVQVVAERLALRHRDVGAQFSRRRQDAERHRVEHLDRPRARGVRRSEQVPDRLEEPVPVRMLHDHAGDVVADLWRASRAAVDGEDLGLVPRSPTERPQRLDGAGIDGSRDQDAVTTRGRPGQVHRLRERGGAVVQRGVRDLEPGQLADHRLVLEQGLEDALGQLRLVRRV